MKSMSRPQRNYSVDEYLEMEARSDARHEYLHGAIIAMSGGTFDHNQIALNLYAALLPARDRGCRAFVNDIRVTMPSGLWTYPDVVAICGGPATVPGKGTTATNPVFIAEVLSSDTAAYDRGQKFDLYRSIPTFRDYLLIDQSTIDVEHRWREGDTWQSKRYTSLDGEIPLTGVPSTLRVRDLYESVSLGRRTPDHS
jgi:Uma2 family endonuclease